MGAWKVEEVRNRLFRTVGLEIEAVQKELNDRTARSLLKGSGIVIDTFDNSAARRLVQQQCRADKIDCLHVGLYADYCEVLWDEGYRVPQDVGGDVCDYPLARNLVLLAVVVACETLVRFVLDTTRENWSGTLRDTGVDSLNRLLDELLDTRFSVLIPRRHNLHHCNDAVATHMPDRDRAPSASICGTRLQFHLAADTRRGLGHRDASRIAWLRRRPDADLQCQNVGDPQTGVLLGHRVEAARQQPTIQCLAHVSDPRTVKMMNRPRIDRRPIVNRHV